MKEELLDAMLDAYVYMLQARYGDNWRAYAQPNVLMAYDWMTMRKKEDEQPVDSSGRSSGSSGSPPGKEPI